MTAEDLLGLTFVSDVRLSPDGSRVAWVQTRIDREKNEYRSHIYVADTAGGPPAQFTNGPRRDTSPRWSPDGRWLAFLSARPAPGREGKDKEGGDGGEPRPQIWVIPAGGGEARQLTNLKHGAGTPVWSPDGTRIAFACRVGPKGLEPAGEPDPDEKDPARKYNKDVKVIHRIIHKLDGVGFFGDKRSHLAVVPFELPAPGPGSHASYPTPVLLTRGEFDVEEPAWSPDGKWLAFASNTDPDADYQRWSDVYAVPSSLPEGGEQAEPVKLTGSLGYVGSPVWSPDGRWVAYLGTELKYGWYSNVRLWKVAVRDGRPAGEPVCLTADFDRSVGDDSITDLREFGGGLAPWWSPDGTRLVCVASDHGTTHLVRVATEGGPVEWLTRGDRVIQEFSLSRDGRRVALLVTDASNPGDVFVGTLSERPGLAGQASPLEAGEQVVVEERAVTAVNRDFLSGIELSLPERFTFESDGLELDGWVVKPAGYQPGRRYPTILQIHGGPMAMYTSAFFHEFQLLAARGFAVVYSNPRGSLGYGQAFCGAIRGDWGNKDYRDVMACVHHAVEHFGFVDGSRLGCAGGSYGGFMTNWIVTHTDEFKAAVTMRSVVNEATMFGCSDFGHHISDEAGGPPWEVPEWYARVSPITHVANCNTPLMIIHSEQDLRCPIEQAEQLFTALKLRRVPTEFVRFPNESHGLSRGGQPWHRVFRLNKIVEWFERCLGAEEAAEREAAD